MNNKSANIPNEAPKISSGFFFLLISFSIQNSKNIPRPQIKDDKYPKFSMANHSSAK